MMVVMRMIVRMTVPAMGMPMMGMGVVRMRVCVIVRHGPDLRAAAAKIK